MRALIVLVVASLSSQILVINGNQDGAKHIPKAIDFGDFVRHYQKSYDQLEATERAKLFFGRTISIFKHNVDYASNKIGHFLTQTEYIDKSPNELTENFSTGDNIDLAPVEEATRFPDLPANEFYETQKDGGYSKLSATDAAGDESHHQQEPIPRKSMNFLEDLTANNGNDINSIGSGEQLRFAAKLLAKSTSTSTDTESPDEELARKSKGIKYRPIVEPNNPNYDPSLLPSQGVMDSVRDFQDSYSQFVMDDFAINMAPYPTPSHTIPQQQQQQQQPDASSFGFSLSSFVQSIKSISDFFDPAETEQMDIDEEEDAKQQNNVAVQQQQASPILTNSFIDPRLLQPITYDIDWRKTGCITHIKSQKDCNACYALATLDLMEFFYCRQKKIATEFSVQYVIDCGARSGLNGCQGGKLSSVGNFIKDFGIQLNTFYPFRGQQNECPFDSQDYTKKLPYPIKPQITGWKMFRQISDWYKWLPRSPLIVGISMPADFFAYGGGIHDGTDCVPDMVHAMLLVGSGVQDGKQFWLLKNTFSYAWGENGYFRLSKQAPLKCFNSAVVARANFNVANQL